MKRAEMKKVVSILLIAICLTRCSHIHSHWTGVVDHFGVYQFEKNRYILTVADSAGLLSYSLEDSNHRMILKSNVKADGMGIYQRWAIGFDDKFNLWINSSDVGTVLLERVGENKYKRTALEQGSELFKVMPPELGRP
jgi:hypothetical protein